ncbi:MAG: LPS export ABC transporter periplasmic protein LptC [Desulfobacteraceae bacterium]|nr:LPS export ABC transporter periplasmic protein LptC [Desulfobacteraceae bacterium]
MPVTIGAKNIKSRKKIKILLVSVIFIVLGVTVALFYKYRQVMESPGSIISSIQNKANITIGNFHQTSTVKGKEEWSLNASSAHLITEKKQVILENPSVVFYSKDGDSICLTADHGILKTDSNDIEVKDNVVIKHNKYVLETESLQYDHEANMFSSEVPIKITGPLLNFAAGSMSFDLKTNKAVFKGNVKGVLSEDITL